MKQVPLLCDILEPFVCYYALGIFKKKDKVCIAPQMYLTSTPVSKSIIKNTSALTT